MFQQAGAIKAGLLGVNQNVIGFIDLESASNSITTFAAAAGGTIAFNDSAAPFLSIGTVGATGLFTGSAGLSTNNSNIDLQSGGAVNFGQAVNAGASGGAVRLVATGDVTQDASGSDNGR